MARRSRRQRGGRESDALRMAREAYEADMNKIKEYKSALNYELSKPETSDEDKISIRGILEGLEEPPTPTAIPTATPIARTPTAIPTATPIARTSSGSEYSYRDDSEFDEGYDSWGGGGRRRRSRRSRRPRKSRRSRRPRKSRRSRRH